MPAIINLGLVNYSTSYPLQKELLSLRWQNKIEDTLVLVQHYPVITVGRSGNKKNILFSRDFLNKRKVAVQEIERGGDVVMHCPGQLVGYPIMDLKNFGRDLHLYLRNLEEVLIKTLQDFGIKGTRKDEYTGVWVDESKIGFIGVAVKHWITYHGFAFNVIPDLEYFSLINPCGMKNGKVTSMSKLLKREVKVEEVLDYLIPNFNEIFGRTCA